MNPPLLNSPGPSYAELFARSAFSQLPFLDGRKLEQAAKDRGISTPPLSRDELMARDRGGELCPVGFSQCNYTVETTWLDPDPGSVIWREECHFKDWQTHAWISRVDGTRWVSERYTPWQLLYVDDVYALNTVRVSVDGLIAGHAIDEHRDAALRQREARAALDERWRPAIKLLVALQTRFWPYRRGRTTLLHPGEDLDDDNVVDPQSVETERFDAHGVLSDFGLDFDGLAALHAVFADAARRVDPAPDWYRLFELAPREKTDALRGQALRARDLYDACFLLRELYRLASGCWLLRADELGDAGLVESPRRRNLSRRDGQRVGATHDELQPVLEELGVYPHRLHFVVEGQTEEIVLRRLLHAFGRRAGYQITNLHGVDQGLRHQSLFAAASEYAARTVLIADMEGELSTTLKRLQCVDLLTDENDLLLWAIGDQPSSFEEANFTLHELAEAISAAARERCPELAVSLTGDELEAGFAEAIEEARLHRRSRPALASIALTLAEDRHHIRVSKPDLARQLAETTIRLFDQGRTLYDIASEDRPLLQRLWQWLHEARPGRTVT